MLALVPFAPPPFAPSPTVAAAMEALVDEGESPVLVLDLAMVRRLLAALRAALPGVRVLYAVKACPEPAVLRELASAGADFDVASAGELDAVVRAGGSARTSSYGNPVKPREHITAAYTAGLRRFAVDSLAEIDKIAAAAPGSEIVVRVAVDQTGADWPLAAKYGATDVPALVERARRQGLVAEGLVFHVGSQQRRPEAFAAAVRHCAATLPDLGLRTLNLGGGWPAQVLDGDPRVSEAAVAALDAAAGLGVALECEPGRALVAAAGTVAARVIGVAERAGERWAYLDVGLYSGLLEADGEITRYPLWTDVEGQLVPTVLAGPTCDSTDVLYRRVPPLLPSGLREGSRVLLGGAGAYTACYASVGFNGFPPLRTRVVDSANADVLEAEVVGVDRTLVHPA